MNRPLTFILVALFIGASLVSCRTKKVDCPAYGKQVERSTSKTA